MGELIAHGLGCVPLVEPIQVRGENGLEFCRGGVGGGGGGFYGEGHDINPIYIPRRE